MEGENKVTTVRSVSAWRGTSQNKFSVSAVIDLQIYVSGHWQCFIDDYIFISNVWCFKFLYNMSHLSTQRPVCTCPAAPDFMKGCEGANLSAC